MPKEVPKVIDKFYGGIVRDDKSKIIGSASNLEELDVFGNQNFFQAEQVMSADTLPASTKVYAFTPGDDDVMYAYGEETGASKVRILSVASGGASNPGDFATLFTGADATNLATTVSDCTFFRTTEASNPTSLYFIKGASATWYISRYNIGGNAEERWTGSAWSSSGSWDSNSQLTGITGSFMRPTQKVIYGELFICHGRFIAKVTSDGTFTQKAFTLPSEWEAVDIIPVGASALILCRNKNRLVNQSKGFWWNLTSLSQFDDSFSLFMGGPCWVVNDKETIKILCAINGTGRFFQLSGPFAGAIPIEIPGVHIANVAAETTTQPISAPKMVSQKDKILYFGLWKTDKTGIYALGKLDNDKPNAFLLSKRFEASGTSDYVNHKPLALHIQGPNYYAAFDVSGTNKISRCESNNTPSRSSDAVYESVEVDFDDPFKDKELASVSIGTKPLPASTSVAVSVATDSAASYTAITKADATNHTGTSSVMAKLSSRAFSNKKSFRVKLALTSATSNSPKVQSILLRATVKDEYATA